MPVILCSHVLTMQKQEAALLFYGECRRLLENQSPYQAQLRRFSPEKSFRSCCLRSIAIKCRTSLGHRRSDGEELMSCVPSSGGCSSRSGRCTEM